MTTLRRSLGTNLVVALGIRRALFWMGVAVLASGTSMRGSAATALQLAQAMDIPTNSIVTASFTSLADATAANTAADWGTFLPLKGTNLAVLSTGKAADENSAGYSPPFPGTAFSNLGTNPAAGQVTCGGVEAVSVYDHTELTLVLAAPTNASGFSLRCNYFSADYPELICSAYSDRFFILLASQALNGNICLDSQTNPISANTTTFHVTSSAALSGTGMGSGVGAATGWFTNTVAVTPGETITLRFIIFDEGDRASDSQALIDGFEWIVPATPPAVYIQRAVALSWASQNDVQYQVQWASQVDTNTWFDLGAPVVGNGTTNFAYDVSEQIPARFYRVQVLQ